jgi:hypothetical protein
MDTKGCQSLDSEVITALAHLRSVAGSREDCALKGITPATRIAEAAVLDA